jgi:uncharacterized coiled-coil protein SlyX
MPTESLSLAELDERLSVVRDNLRDLVEQAAAYSGAGDEERMNDRIADQQAELDELTRQRDALLQRPA